MTKTKKVMLTAEVPAAIVARLTRLAYDAGQSRSALVRKAISDLIERQAASTPDRSSRWVPGPTMAT